MFSNGKIDQVDCLKGKYLKEMGFWGKRYRAKLWIILGGGVACTAVLPSGAGGSCL